MSLVDLFVLFSFLLGTVSAILVAFHPNVLYAAIALIFSLLSVSGMYAVLGADFLAAVQLIIYVGGIIIVILFAIMMSENIYRVRFIEQARRYLLPSIVAVACGGGLFWLFQNVAWNGLKEKIDSSSTLLETGKALVGPYALVFQYVSVVLLAGLIGAVIVARPDHHDHGIEEDQP